ncbi:amidase family protein [Nonlabens xiamenensis]|uniref:amidase family protein n=1 Tax=Nonlabens xiamenensis TaxID=2341043 RepID=UPI000F60ACDC|nr:amidase family protein [Nonlabens xiamenensis]
MKKFFLLLPILFLACKSQDGVDPKKSKDDFREFKVLDSAYLTKEQVFGPLLGQVQRFRESGLTNNRTQEIETVVLEGSIPAVQQAIFDGQLTYEELTLFYLDRIYTYDRWNTKSLNAVIALNPQALEQARAADRDLQYLKSQSAVFNPYSLKGMPVLLKDNINTEDMVTTAGAAVLRENSTTNAPLVDKLRQEAAVILGKANLSEWAYFFCGDCPSGYSAVGGQTLNPYGRRSLDTGGSSSGSGVAVAANFAMAAIGTETSGSILSPSSANSVVGMKPTVGTINGQGIVPISSYLDTAGPMTKWVIDNAILMDAISSVELFEKGIGSLATADLSGKRFGVFPAYRENPLYAQALKDLENLGATLVDLEERELELKGFLQLLNLDMKKDLPAYFMGQSNEKYRGWDVEKVMQYNRQDSLRSMPYGQKLFQGILNEPPLSDAEFWKFKQEMTAKAQEHFDYYIKNNNLDGFVSINNYDAGIAAVGFYPALTVPMGYGEKGKPFGLTFIAPNEEDAQLYTWASAFEKATMHRQPPANY